MQKKTTQSEPNSVFAIEYDEQSEEEEEKKEKSIKIPANNISSHTLSFYSFWFDYIAQQQRERFDGILWKSLLARCLVPMVVAHLTAIEEHGWWTSENTSRESSREFRIEKGKSNQTLVYSSQRREDVNWRCWTRLFAWLRRNYWHSHKSFFRAVCGDGERRRLLVDCGGCASGGKSNLSCFRQHSTHDWSIKNIHSIIISLQKG